MRPIALAAILAIAAAGCGGTTHDKTSATPVAAAKPSPSSSACDPGDDSCIPPDHPTAGALPVPAAKVGQTMRLQLPTQDGIAQVDFTLTGLKLIRRQLCFGFKLKNAGTFTLDSPGFSWVWFGLDGQQTEPGPGVEVACGKLGHEFQGLDQPAPRPGKYVTGYYSFEVPAAPGAVEVTDTDGSPLFRLDYGKQSDQVPIDARGQ